MDEVIKREIEEARKVMVNRQHSQHYGFVVEPSEERELIFAAEIDEDMEAMVVVYWEKDDTFVVGSVREGEEVSVWVYEDGRRLIGSWSFYHAAGIKFHAKREHEYSMKVATRGINKMLVMDVENFVAKGSSSHIAAKEHIEPHEQRIKVLH